MTDYEIDLSDDPTFPVVRTKNIGILGKNVEYFCREEYYDDYDKAKGSSKVCYVDVGELENVIEDNLEGNGIISNKCKVKVVGSDNPPGTAILESNRILASFEITKDKKLIEDNEASISYGDSEKRYKREPIEPESCPHCGAEMEEEYYEEPQRGYVNLTEIEMTFDEDNLENIKNACL